MAIVKASYTRSRGAAKANIRYIQHRKGREETRTTRTLFGIDGAMGRYDAYRMIENAEQGSVFFRIIISPDPKGEDTQKDLRLWEITENTMHKLEERIHKQVAWAASEHHDHTPNRHVHVLAVVAGRLNSQDFQALRQSATEACLMQRQELDLAQTPKEQEREEVERERSVG
jgi:hypothetical protein